MGSFALRDQRMRSWLRAGCGLLGVLVLPATTVFHCVPHLPAGPADAEVAASRLRDAPGPLPQGMMGAPAEDGSGHQHAAGEKTCCFESSCMVSGHLQEPRPLDVCGLNEWRPAQDTTLGSVALQAALAARGAGRQIRRPWTRHDAFTRCITRLF